MRIFGEAKDGGSSSAQRAVTTPVVAVRDDLVETDEHVLPDLSRTEEMPIVREAPANGAPAVAAEQARGEDEGDSDVFLVRRSAPELPALTAEALAAAAAAAEGVTLFVYGWENVQPGPLSWAFPSLRAALLAVRTMRNAVEWCICSGREPSIDAARAKGAILIEQNA
jgi:hypothetical protein